MERIYLDHAATTPMHPKVAEKIFEAHNVNFGNASSIHSFGREARHLLDQILVSVMYGNNEVGTLQPIAEIGQILAEHQAFFHTDAVQAYGIEDIDVNKSSIDLLAVSAHKINGPKGTGFLFDRENVKLTPRTFGGDQERKRRAGTENVPSLIGFGEAIRISQAERADKREKFKQYKESFVNVFQQEDIEFSLNEILEYSLPHVLNLSFPGTNVESMLVNLDIARIAVSSGSACTAGSVEPSHVLVAMFGKIQSV